MEAGHSQAVSKPYWVRTSFIPYILIHSKKGSWEWNNYTVFFPTELEVFGYKTFGGDSNWYNTDVQYPIYAKSIVYRSKRYNGAQTWWWKSEPLASDPTSFCSMSHTGHAANSYASNAAGGVSPVFCVA
jgi:hypothetical protein